jgi:hypothetical protein
MARFALVEPDGRVAQIVEHNQSRFPVHESLKWVLAPEYVTTAFRWNGEAFVEPEQ